MSTPCRVVDIPGPPGVNGAAGAAGTDGANAYGTLLAPFFMPAIGGTVTIEVDSTAWMVPAEGSVNGQALAVEFAGTLLVAAIVDGTHVTLYNPGYTGNCPAAVLIPIGSRIGVSGIQGQIGASPGGALLAVNNLSDVISVAASRASLGLGSLAVLNAVNDANWSGAQLAIANGGTGAANAAAARTALGLAIGTNVEAYDALLAGLAAAGPGAADEVPYLTAANTWAMTSLTLAMRALLASASNAVFRASISVNRTPQDIIILRDQKAAGTDGGTFTSGAWQTRDLNTEIVDTGSHCSLAGNQFTLADGVYRIRARAPAHRVDPHQIRLFDIVAAAVVTEGGQLAYGANADTVTTADDITAAHLTFRFTVTGGPRAYTIQHRCTTTRATDGFGSANNFGGPEIYTEVVLEREVG